MNSFILLKEEKKRIQKLYEATTASSSGAFEQPMGFSVPGLGGDVEVLDIETTFIDGDNVQDGSVEINLDIEDIADLLNVTEEDDKKRMRKLHRINSVIEEQSELPIELPTISPECVACGMKSLSGERITPFGVSLGTYDYTKDADDILATVAKIMMGKEPTLEEISKILVTVAVKFPRLAADSGYIAYGLYNNECDGGGTALDCLSEAVGSIDLPDIDTVEDVMLDVQQKLDN